MDCILKNWKLNELVLMLAKPGVIGLFDESAKEVHILCSNNLLYKLGYAVNKMLQGDHPCSNTISNLDLRVLYIGDSPKLEGSKIMKELCSNGYKVLNQRPPIILKAKLRILDKENGKVIVVTLRNAGGHEFIVAAFNDLTDAKAWYELNYKDGIVNTILQLEDELTKEVMQYFE